jgi:hypothetical protein
MMEEKLMSTPAVRTTQQIARPLKVLIPLIQGELQQGDVAGREHYTEAGRMLIEAKPQKAKGAWGRWLNENFELSQSTARRYMRWARLQDDHGVTEMPTSMREMTGDTTRDREHRNSKQQKAYRDVMRDIARDEFMQERQARDVEVDLHRTLAGELIDIGYRALATHLHPDRGGSKDAMARLNRVRDELKEVAQTRRFL